MIRIPLTLSLIVLTFPQSLASQNFEITNIPTPPNVDPQIGGLDFTPSGKLAACFHRGEIAIYDPATKTWLPFASGLHEPLGIKAISESEFIVVQRPELTRVSDTDADGTADLFRTLSDDFGLSGNYHEFAFGPVAAPDGSLFISLNVASNKRGVFPEVRGDWSAIGLPREQMTDNPDWDDVQKEAGRMFSRVPYRGWVLKIDPNTGTIEPFCSGLRSPNGLCFDRDGELYVTDNQGDWVGTSKLFHAQKDDFLGHPASLVWTENWDGRNPLNIPDTELDTLRTRAAVLLPGSTIAHSPTAPVLVPGGLPFAGQLICGEMNRPRLLRFMLETVSGVRQGAVTPLLDGTRLNPGINRLAFAPDNTLFAGSTHLSWAGGEGIQKIVFPTSTPPAILAATLRKDDCGLDLTFTQKVDPASLSPTSFKIRRYYFEYHADYGSDEYGIEDVPVFSATLSPDETGASLDLGPVKPGYVYEITPSNMATRSGVKFTPPIICYTVRRLHDGTEAPPQLASTRQSNTPLWIAAASGAAILFALTLLYLKSKKSRRRD